MNDSLSLKEDLSELDLRNSNIPYTKRKILLLGGQGVGKTSIIKRFKNNTFTEDYEQTIQITTKKVIKLNNDYIDLEIVDFEGQTEYTIFSPNKFSFGYNGYMLVYDVKDKKSFELINFIYEQINNLSGKTSKILVGTKSDNDNSREISYRQVSSKEGKKLAENIHCPFIEISSQDNKNIEEAFRLLLIEINKTESDFNLKKLKFLKIFQFFIHYPKFTIYSYYINLIFFIVLSLILFSLGIILEIDINDNNDNYFFGIGFPFTILGLWGLIFSISGIFGIYQKNIYLLELNYYGSIINGIYLTLSICQIFIICFLQRNNCSYSYILELILVINIVPLILIAILSKIFKIIYQYDLQSYMA